MIREAAMTILAATSLYTGQPAECTYAEGVNSWNGPNGRTDLHVAVEYCGDDVAARLSFVTDGYPTLVQVWDENGNGYRQGEDDRILMVNPDRWMEIDGLEAMTHEGSAGELPEGMVQNMYFQFMQMTRDALMGPPPIPPERG